MWPYRVSSPGPLVLESDALPTAQRSGNMWKNNVLFKFFAS